MNTVLDRLPLPTAPGSRVNMEAGRHKYALRREHAHTCWPLANALALLAFLLLPLPNAARFRTVSIPFRTVQSLIVFQGAVNGNPATFLLDTGANRTIVSPKIYANARFDLQRMPPRQGGAGYSGYSLRRSADISLASNTWTAQQVSVMDLGELKKMLHMDFDALLGQDFLRQFRSVRIDYRTRIIELEE